MKKLSLINKIIAAVIVVALFFLVVGVAYSYYVAKLSGQEIGTTITGKTGNMKIDYEGGAELSAIDIAPSNEPFIIKNFTVTGTNTTDAEMPYQIMMVIDENTFSTDAISYTLTGTNTSGNGEVAPDITNRENLNTLDKSIGSGKFIGKVTNSIHSYELKLYFYETDYDQLGDLGKTFRAHLEIKNNPLLLEGDFIL